VGSDKIIKGITRSDSPGNSKGVIGNDHENSCGITGDDHTGIMGYDSKEITKGDILGHYEVYVVSPLLKGELGVALIDSGSQILLVK
jgi:hypothetical protein